MKVVEKAACLKAASLFIYDICVDYLKIGLTLKQVTIT